MKLGPYDLNSIVTGDSRELAKAIPDESVDLIFTDPPYPKEYLPLYKWLAETAARVLKPGGLLITLAGNLYANKVMSYLESHLTYYWIGGMPNSLGATNAVHPRQILSGWKPCFWYSKGTPDKHPYIFDFFQSKVDKRYHEWGQPLAWSQYYIDKLTDKNSILFEPFAGGGSVPAACTVLGVNYLAFESDPDTAESARQRVANTQPPLPMVYAKQGTLI